LAPSNDHSAFEMLINNATPVQILGLYSWDGCDQLLSEFYCLWHWLYQQLTAVTGSSRGSSIDCYHSFLTL
jgi:hypothetical protein